MFLVNYNMSSKPRSHPGAKRETFSLNSFNPFSQQIFIVLNEYSWKEGWGGLEEFIHLFNKYLLNTYCVPDIDWGARHGGGEQDSRELFSHGAHICINENMYKWGNMDSDKWQWLEGRIGRLEEACEDWGAESSKWREAAFAKALEQE